MARLSVREKSAGVDLQIRVHADLDLLLRVDPEKTVRVPDLRIVPPDAWEPTPSSCQLGSEL